MSSADYWLDIVRREAQNALFSIQSKGTLVATSYNPDKHAIKGILVPHGIETGWVPIGVHHSGNGYGIAVGPKVGSADKLDGDQFDIEFEFGDPNRPMATSRRFSIPDTPPRVESGEMLLQQEGSEKGKNNKLFFDKDKAITLNHESGNSLTFAKDKSITVKHFAKGGTIAFDQDGKLAVNTQGQDVAIDAGAGTHTLSAKSFNISGDISHTGNLTTSGSITAASILEGAKPVATVA